jgi:GTP pyrophosphokinase
MTRHQVPRFPVPELLPALQLATELHAHQVRKGTDTPYLVHLLEVAALVAEYGGGLEEVQAALLHDALEDGRPRDGIRARLDAISPRVRRIVEGCTDTERVPKPPWHERKAAYLGRLRGADAATRLVAAADKLANATAVLRDLHRCGGGVWGRFRVGRADQLWYYRGCLAALSEGETGEHLAQLVAELRRRVDEIERFDADAARR